MLAVADVEVQITQSFFELNGLFLIDLHLEKDDHRVFLPGIQLNTAIFIGNVDTVFGLYFETLYKLPGFGKLGVRAQAHQKK
jgi:hypothetical protein